MFKYLSINITFELLCLLSAIIFLGKEKAMQWRSNMFFMVLTVVVELIGRWLNLNKHGHANSVLYNILTLPESIFISYMFVWLFKPYFNSRPVILTGLALIYSMLVIELTRNGLFKNTNITIAIMSLIFSLYSLFYLYLFLYKEGYVDLQNYAPFWWITGTLIFYFGGQATNILFSIKRFSGDEFRNLNHYIYIALNILLYGFWSYSYRCRYQQRKSSYSSY